MFFMEQRCGAFQHGGNEERGQIEFRIFFPAGFDPEIAEIRVAGEFQSELGGTDWDFPGGPVMQQRLVAEGTFYEVITTGTVTAGYYQYKYLVRFRDGVARIVSDPCSRYGGRDHQNAAVVIGGSQLASIPLVPLPARQPIERLTVYELMIDDFTDDFRAERAPLAAVEDRLDYLQDLGFNAILFMPWTAWKNTDFDWGYEPFQYFSVEDRYSRELNAPAEKLSHLKRLVNACHARGIHVIMDGVFNHVSVDFAYKQMYRNPDVCPFTGTFGGTFTGLQDLNFNNSCTQDLIRDVCLYWIEEFGIDGIRFDNTVNYDIPGDMRGLPQLLEQTAGFVQSRGEQNFSLTLEHLQLDAASVTNNTAANSYWDNELFGRTFEGLWEGRIDGRLLRALNHAQFLDPAKRPTQYLSNHDHSHVTWQAGARNNAGLDRWFTTQPYAIALFMGTSVPMVQNGQEFGEEHRLPEDDKGTGRRVAARPLRWKFASDPVGSTLGKLYGALARARRDHPGLCSRNFAPGDWQEWQTRFDRDGLGVDEEKQVMIFHRWGDAADGALERFVIVLNFSDSEQFVSAPFPVDGEWTDLLSNFDGSWKPHVTNLRLGVTVGSHWGHVFFRRN